MNVFLDTNVVIDYLAAREPFCHEVRTKKACSTYNTYAQLSKLKKAVNRIAYYC